MKLLLLNSNEAKKEGIWKTLSEGRMQCEMENLILQEYDNIYMLFFLVKLNNTSFLFIWMILRESEQRIPFAECLHSNEGLFALDKHD